VILVLAFYPQFVLRRTEPAVKAAVTVAQPRLFASSGRTGYATLGGGTGYAPLGAHP
jgi:hypothetical protein